MKTKPLRTVKVRVLVVTTDDGYYETIGNAGLSPRDARKELGRLAAETIDPPTFYHWIEAEVPIPDKLSRKPITARVER